MKCKLLSTVLAVGTLFSTCVCFAQSIPVTIVNDSGQNMYLTATEGTKVGIKGDPKLSPVLNYGASGDFTKINNSTIMIPSGKRMAFTADDNYDGPYKNLTTGISSGRIYASLGSALKMPSNGFVTVMLNPQTFGYLEMTYTPGGKTCDLTNVDSFEPVRFQIEVFKNGSNVASETSTYYDTYKNVYDKLSGICPNSIDKVNTNRINSPKDNPTAWANTLTQDQINKYFSTNFKIKKNISMNYSSEVAGGYYTLSYDCIYNKGIIECTKTSKSKSGQSGWTGGIPAKVIKLYVTTPAPGGGQLTPACVFANTAPQGEFFYSYDGTLGNIGQDINLPGSLPDMSCDFVSDKLLAPLKTGNEKNTYSGIIDKTSDAYSKPNSDAGPRQGIVLKNLQDATSMTLTLLGEDFKSSLKPPKPPGPSKQVPVNNGSDKITAVFYFQPGGVDEGKVITYNGVKKTLLENSNFNTKLSCTFGKTNKWPITFDGKYATLQVDIASDGTMSNAKFDPNPKPNTGGGNLNINFSE